MKTTLRSLLSIALAAALLGSVVPLFAGPVPGVESISKTPVTFPTPPSITAWETAEGDYLVTFRWKPDASVSNPGVAGEFNGWSRSDLPMNGPDAEGAYTVTTRMPAGVFQYKFIGGTDQWLQDPANPEASDDGHGNKNSVLRLGIWAEIANVEARKGDGEIEIRAALHDPAQLTYYDVFSPQDVMIRLRVLRDDAEGATLLLIAQDGTRHSVPMEHAGADKQFDFFEYHLHLSRAAHSRPVAYAFELLDASTTVELGDPRPLILDPTTIVETPDWAKDAIWYQIMVDRFRDGNPKNNPEYTRDTGRVAVTHPWTSEWYMEQPYEREDGETFWEWSMYNRLYGGDFEGLIEKLDYLDDLGVNAIYLNPVFEATNAHKYNGKSYIHADDGYGVPGEFAKSVAKENLLDSSTWEFNESDKLLLKVIEEAHKRDMHIIFDGVFNHLGEKSVPFLDVKKNGKDSAFADWYIITSWEPFEYKGWAGFGGLPEFRKTDDDLASESLKHYIFDCTRRWMDPNGDGDPSDGIDGWRLDVPFEIPLGFWRQWRDVVKTTNPDAYTVGEVWDPAEKWLDGKTFDAVMNYEFSRAAFRFFGNLNDRSTASELDNELGRLRLRYPRQCTYVMQNLFDSHDTDRWVSRLMNPDMGYDQANRLQDSNPDYFDQRPSDTAYQRLELMALFQLTYVGAPMIYYGTEAGMFGADDPRNRMPMWWQDLAPYDSPDYIIMDDLRDEFRNLFALRSNEELLRRGDFRTLITDDDKEVYAYLRYAMKEKEAIAVVLNNSAREQTVILPGDGTFQLLHGNGTMRAASGGLSVTLPPISGVVLRVPSNAARVSMHQR